MSEGLAMVGPGVGTPTSDPQPHASHEERIQMAEAEINRLHQLFAYQARQLERLARSVGMCLEPAPEIESVQPQTSMNV